MHLKSNKVNFNLKLFSFLLAVIYLPLKSQNFKKMNSLFKSFESKHKIKSSKMEIKEIKKRNSIQNRT